MGAPRNAQPTPLFPSHFELKTFDAYSHYSKLVLEAVAVISNVSCFAALRYDTFIQTIGKHQNDFDHASTRPRKVDDNVRRSCFSGGDRG